MKKLFAAGAAVVVATTLAVAGAGGANLGGTSGVWYGCANKNSNYISASKIRFEQLPTCASNEYLVNSEGMPVATTTTVAPTTTTTRPATTTTTVPSSARALPYDARSPWNTPIAAGTPAVANSAGFISEIAKTGALTSDVDQFTIAVYPFNASTPLVNVKGDGYFSTYDTNDSSRVGAGSPWSVSVPLPTGVVPPAGSDGQVVLYDEARGIEYAFWQLHRDLAGQWRASNGYRYHTTAGFFGRFADGLAGRGAGLPYLAGLVRPWEIAQGRIDHALAFAYSAPAGTFVYPASKSDGAGFGGTSADAPEGSRLQLDPNYDLSGLSANARIIARALQTYGAYIVDNSGSPKVYVESRNTAGWDSSWTRSILSSIPWSAFRVVAAPTPSA